MTIDRPEVAIRGESSPRNSRRDHINHRVVIRVGGTEPAVRRRLRPARGEVRVYFANVTRWNAQAVEYLARESAMATADAVCVCVSWSTT